MVQTAEREQFSLFDLDFWPTTLTYNPRLAKVKVDPRVKNQGQRSNGSNRRAPTDKRTNGCYTKRIIALATRSIIRHQRNVLTDTFSANSTALSITGSYSTNGWYIQQEGLAVATIARDDPSTLAGDDPFPRAHWTINSSVLAPACTATAMRGKLRSEFET